MSMAVDGLAFRKRIPSFRQQMVKLTFEIGAEHDTPSGPLSRISNARCRRNKQLSSRTNLNRVKSTGNWRPSSAVTPTAMCFLSRTSGRATRLSYPSKAMESLWLDVARASTRGPQARLATVHLYRVLLGVRVSGDRSDR